MAYSEADVSNALVATKDSLLHSLNSGNLERIWFVVCFLSVVRDEWIALDYGYKGAELLERAAVELAKYAEQADDLKSIRIKIKTARKKADRYWKQHNAKMYPSPGGDEKMGIKDVSAQNCPYCGRKEEPSLEDMLTIRLTPNERIW